MKMRTLVLERLRQVDTVGTTESAEFGNTVVKVNVAEAGAGVIEAGARGADHGGERVAAGSSSGKGGKGCVVFGKDFMEED